MRSTETYIILTINSYNIILCREISEAINNIWEQIKIFINQYLQNENQSIMDMTAESMLRNQIMQIGNKESPVRQLMCKYLFC